MKKQFFLFYLVSLTIYLTVGVLQPAGAATHPLAQKGTHVCGVSDSWVAKRYADQYPNRHYARSFAANLNVGQPRIVRMIYFLPNDRPYRHRPGVVQKMKNEIRTVQTFFAEQMEAHGYGRRTFRVETDAQGEPIVHRMDGKHPDSYYLDNSSVTVPDEVSEAFNFEANVYLIVIDNSTHSIGTGDEEDAAGVGSRSGKNGGFALVSDRFGWGIIAHELGHAFGLQHDFRDGASLMSYGGYLSLWRVSKRLSACSAEFLSLHSYFNPNIPVEMEEPPTIELISPRSYPASSQSVSVRVRVSDPDGLHQVILHAAQPDNRWSVKFCRGFSGEKSKIIEFDYDGVIPSAHEPSYSISTSLLNPIVHPIVIEAVDMNGDVDSSMEDGHFRFVLFSEALQPLTKISGDNQHGLPNTPLPAPFVVELWDLNDGSVRRGVPVTFTVTAGGGSLSQVRTETNRNGRAETTLTLGPDFGENRIEVSAEGLTVTFSAVAGVPVDMPDANLRTAIEEALDKVPGTPITPAEMATFISLEAFNISDLTGLEYATNLTELRLRGNLTDISAVSGLTNLTELRLGGNLTDISVVSGLTNLTELYLNGNNITDISAVSGLTNLTQLFLDRNNISDISPLAELPNLIHLSLDRNNLTDISAVSGLTNLTQLFLDRNNISDISPLVELPNLMHLELIGNNITDISAVSGLTNLTQLFLDRNNISDISPLAGLTHLTYLSLEDNLVSDLSPLVTNTGLGMELGRRDIVNVIGNPLSAASINTHIPMLQGRGVVVLFYAVVAQPVNIPDPNLRAAIEKARGRASGATITTVDMVRLTRLEAPNANISDLTGLESATKLTTLDLDENNITDISPVVGLTNLTKLWLTDNNISDLSPLVANTGLGRGDEVKVDGNPLSYTSINTHIPTLRSGGVVVHANNLKPPTLEDTLSIPAGLNLIHVPLKVSAVDGVAKTLTSISDLYDALGGANAVNFLITYDTSTQGWLSYFGNTDRGTANDKALTDVMGILAGMKAPTSVRLTGKPLGNNGTSTISLNQGLNVVGLPLRDSRINRVSDLLNLEGIQGNVPVIIVTVDGDFKSVGRAGDPGDVPITGGQGFLLTVQRATTVTLSGEGWTNSSATAAPQILTGLPVRHTTPVLALKGSIVDEVLAVNRVGFRVAVKNLSTGRQGATTIADAETGYRLAVVDIETQRAAQVGDTLEISAQSTNPFVGVRPLRYAVTAEDVLQGWIQLSELVAYEIPKETELLANYPNPFNPETWIPYRLAADADVKLTIYDANGQLVRSLDVGHRVAAVYESRSKAIYWDGRNAVGEQVASGVYFYHLDAGSYSATRKMLILK